MWNNMKEIPENYNLKVTSIYEFGKNIGEYMSSEGECLALLEVGKFMLYLDVVGEASFEYKGKTYRYREDINERLERMIREESTEIEWMQKPELRLYLTVDEDPYSGFELDIDCEVLLNELAIEVMMARLLVDSIYLIDRDKVESENGVVGIASVLEEKDKAFLELLHNYKQLTTLLPWDMHPEKSVDIVYDRIAEKPGLANVVSMVNVMTQYREEENQVEITASWTSDNQAVDKEMRHIAGVWS